LNPVFPATVAFTTGVNRASKVPSLILNKPDLSHLKGVFLSKRFFDFQFDRLWKSSMAV